MELKHRSRYSLFLRPYLVNMLNESLPLYRQFLRPFLQSVLQPDFQASNSHLQDTTFSITGKSCARTQEELLRDHVSTLEPPPTLPIALRTIPNPTHIFFHVFVFAPLGFFQDTGTRLGVRCTAHRVVDIQYHDTTGTATCYGSQPTQSPEAYSVTYISRDLACGSSTPTLPLSASCLHRWAATLCPFLSLHSWM